MDRRDFVTGLIGAGALAAAPGMTRAAAGEEAWKAGPIDHLLPTVNDRRLLLKVSFTRPFAAVSLAVDDRRIAGQRTDTEGKFWQFDVPNLEPGRSYTLVITDAAGAPLADPWPIRTFPDPQDAPAKLRLAI